MDRATYDEYIRRAEAAAELEAQLIHAVRSYLAITYRVDYSNCAVKVEQAGPTILRVQVLPPPTASTGQTTGIFHIDTSLLLSEG